MEGMAMCVTFPFLIFNLNISRTKILLLGKIKVSKGLYSLNKSEEIGIGNYCNHKKIIRDTNTEYVAQKWKIEIGK